MTEVQQFTPATIEAHFGREGVKYLRDDMGRYLALFGASTTRPFDVQVWVYPEGDDGQICVVRVLTKEYFQADDRPRLLALVNEWNSAYRWPKAYVSTASGNDGLVFLVAETQLDFATGVHPEGLDQHIRTAVGSAGQFFSHVHEQSRPPAATLDVSEFEDRWHEAS